MGLKEIAEAARRKSRPVNCPHCGHTSVQFEGSSYDCENCTIGVPPALNRVEPPGYDLKAARKKREDCRTLALVLGCLAVLLSTASIVTAHTLHEVLWRLAALAAGVTWAHCLLVLDER